MAGVPDKTQSFVLIVHDPDAPRPAVSRTGCCTTSRNDSHIGENISHDEEVAGLGLQGKNDGGKIGYIGPAPPSGTHRYFFRLFAIDKMLDLPAGATHKEISAAVKGHILAQSELMGTYEKKSKAA